jgi:transposase
MAIKVDADYTSKACPICGYRDEKNRPFIRLRRYRLEGVSYVSQ